MDRQCNTNMTKKKRNIPKHSLLFDCSRDYCVFIQLNNMTFLLSHLTTNSHIPTTTQALLCPIRLYCFFCVCVPKKKQQRCCAVGARKSRQCSECVECSSPDFVGWFCSCHSHLGERINILGWSGTTLMYISAKKKKVDFLSFFLLQAKYIKIYIKPISSYLFLLISGLKVVQKCIKIYLITII